MRAYPVKQFGIENLQPNELPELQIIPDTVLIKVHAVSQSSTKTTPKTGRR